MIKVLNRYEIWEFIFMNKSLFSEVCGRTDGWFAQKKGSPEYEEPFFVGTIQSKSIDQSTKTNREMIRWSLK